jgi:ribosomal protein L16 Arg81 hydroxylase
MSKYLRKSTVNPDKALANTTSIDVFESTEMDQQLIQAAMSAVLEPGDLLYMPPLWWHAMRSEDISASVSMWF